LIDRKSEGKRQTGKTCCVIIRSNDGVTGHQGFRYSHHEEVPWLGDREIVIFLENDTRDVKNNEDTQ